MTFEQFKQKVDDTFMEHQASQSGGKVSAANQWRYGQAIMNVLWDIWPEKHNKIMHTEYDCFYSNGNVEKLLAKLEKEWDA